MKRRDAGIDFLMFVAILMVVNSHLEEMYVGCFKPLATGGVLGDALFFFCSGYKLFLGRMDRFDNWYKRRIVRIYPSIIVWDVIAASVLPLPLTPLTLFDGWCPTGGYWFVKCIMVHYVAIYIIRRFFFDYLRLVMGLVWVAVLTWWGLCYSPRFAMAMFGSSKFEWLYLFIFMLLGAMLGMRNKEQMTGGPIRIYRGLTVSVLSVVAHYGFLDIVQRCPCLMPVRVAVLLPMVGVIYGLYLISRSYEIAVFMGTRLGQAVGFLGALCLEVYISSPYLQTSAYNQYFPLNIIGFFVAAFMLAYLIRSISRFVVQTFDKNSPYDYSAIFK